MQVLCYGKLRHFAPYKVYPEVLRPLLQLWLVLTILAFSVSAQAAHITNITNATGIYRLNVQTAAATLLYSGAPFNGTTTVAGMAMRPSDGMLFFTFSNITNQQVYRWNPATPATAPVLLGTTGAAVPYIHRLTFHPTNGLLYGSDINGTALWTISQTTGAATNVATITGIPAKIGRAHV